MKWILPACGEIQPAETLPGSYLPNPHQMPGFPARQDEFILGTTIMSNTSSAEKARQERRLRSASFLASLGVERTTVFLIGAVVGLVFAFLTIVTTESPDSKETDANSTETNEMISESDEVLVIPR